MIGEIPCLARDNTDRVQWFEEIQRPPVTGEMTLQNEQVFVGENRMTSMGEIFDWYIFVDWCMQNNKLPDIPFAVHRNPDGTYDRDMYDSRKAKSRGVAKNPWNCHPDYCDRSTVCLRDIGGTPNLTEGAQKVLPSG